MTIVRSPDKQLKVKQFPEFAVLGARPPYWINKGLWDVWDNTLHLRRGSLGLAYFTRRFFFQYLPFTKTLNETEHIFLSFSFQFQGRND